MVFETYRNESRYKVSEPISDGGPAFPVPMIPCDNQGGFTEVRYRGISRLDYFAGQAMANSAIAHSGLSAEDKAHQCRRHAVLLIKELERINASV